MPGSGPSETLCIIKYFAKCGLLAGIQDIVKK
jgi:hypothetical protein